MSTYNATQFYHATEKPRVVRSAEDAAALGPEWFDSPKAAAAAKAAADAKAAKKGKDKE